MSKRIFIIFGNHKYKSGTSFNEAVREEFIKTAKELGHEIDLINVYEEKQIKFWDGSRADEYEQIVNYRKRIEGSDVIFIMSPCHNFSVNSATANVISWIFAPPWAFSYRQIIGSWGTPVPNKIKNKKVVIGLTYGSPSPIITFAVHQIPRRVQKMVFKHLCGAKVEYLRMYEVLPNMPKKIFDKHMASVRNLVKKL